MEWISLDLSRRKFLRGLCAKNLLSYIGGNTEELGERIAEFFRRKYTINE